MRCVQALIPTVNSPRRFKVDAGSLESVMTRKTGSCRASAALPASEALLSPATGSPSPPQRPWAENPSTRQENQDDAASEHRDNQSDSSERGAWERGKPTTLEELLDMELDVHHTSNSERDRRRVQASGNQASPDELSFAGSSELSLELLALQSPHGQGQQWEDDPAFLSRDVLFEPKEVPCAMPQLKRVPSATSSDGTADLVSPSRHMAAFALSPSRTASGDEFDLISPVALPESPEARPRVPSWDRLPALVLDKEIDWSSSSTARSADWPRRPRHRSSASPPRSTATTKSPPRSVHLERKPKAKHGGIYSLLLKYKSPEQAPVLVDDLQSPDLAWAAAQSSSLPQSPPLSADKPQHGGIYRVLRRASSQR